MKAKTKAPGTQPSLWVDSEVVRMIRQHARSSEKAEICGVLIGQDRDQRVEVAACIEGQNADSAGAHVTFTQDTWEHIYAVKDQKYPDARIVGWYHSHPGFGVFLSEHDTFIHKNFFSSPGQVAWVFDPHSDEEGCFGWVNGKIERLTRISVVDRRGGETAEATGKPEPAIAVSDERKSGNKKESGNKESTERKRQKPAVVVRGFDVEESEDQRGLPLEQLVMQVFFYLAVLALGFSLSHFFFPRLVAVPVAVDPMTGLPLDPQLRREFEEKELELQGSAGNSQSKPNPSSSPAPATPDHNSAKGNDARSK